MRNLLYILFILPLLLSCSSDDDANRTNTLVGAWNLVEYNLPQASDLNGDGTESENVIAQLPCFNGSIVFFENGNFNAAMSTLENSQNEDGEEIFFCGDPVSSSGTWQFNNNQLNLTSSNETISGPADLEGNTLIRTLVVEGLGQVELIYNR